MGTIISHKQKYFHILYILFNYLLIIDSINGVLLALGIPLPISMLYKLLIIALLLPSYICQPRHNGTSFFTSLYIILLSSYFALYIDVDSIFDSLSLYIRFIILPLALWFFTKGSQDYPELAYHYSKRIIYINAAVICCNIALSMIGIGYTSYGEGIGNKGFFYAANEVSGLIILLFGLVLFISKILSKKAEFYILAFLFFVFSVSFGTKTAMGGFLIILIYIILNFSRSNKRYNKIVTYIFLAIFVPLVVYVGYKFIDSIGLLERWKYFYDKSDDIITFMLSGRNEFWAQEKNEILSHGFFGILCGIGGNRTVEMDPFDVFLNYGVIGVVLIYSFWIKMIYNAYKYSKFNQMAKIVLFIDCELIIFSVFTGHIIFSAMLTPFIALINSLVCIRDEIILINK